MATTQNNRITRSQSLDNIIVAPIRGSSLARTPSVDFHASTETLVFRSDTTLFFRELSELTLAQPFEIPDLIDSASMYESDTESYSEILEAYQSWLTSDDETLDLPPSPILVGVEENPGPSFHYDEANCLNAEDYFDAMRPTFAGLTVAMCEASLARNGDIMVYFDCAHYSFDRTRTDLVTDEIADLIDLLEDTVGYLDIADFFQGFFAMLQIGVPDIPLPPPLVGIETNPGPNFEFDEGFCMSDEEFSQLTAPLIADLTADLFAEFRESSYNTEIFAHAEMYALLHIRTNFVSNPVANLIDHLLEMFGEQLLEIYFQGLYNTLIAEAQPPAPRLVGIETNPGPCILSTLRSNSSSMNGLLPQMQLPFSLGVDEETKNLVSQLILGLHTASDSLSGAKLDVTSSQIDSLIQALPSADKLSDYTVQFMLLVGFATLSFKASKSSETGKWYVLTSVLGFYIGYKYGVTSVIARSAMALSAIINTFNTPEEECIKMQPQMNVGESFMSPILGFIYYQAFSKHCTDGSIKGFMKDIADIPKQKEGLSQFIDFILLTSEKFANFLLQKCGMETVNLRNNVFPEIEEFHSKIMTIIESFRAGAPYNYDNAMLIFHLEKEVNNLIAKIPNTKDCADYKRNALSLLTLLKPLISKMERNNIVGNGPRREPLGIMLGGPTGVGKSTTIIPLILATNAQVLPKEKLDSFVTNHNDHIWNFVPENPFHDSYHGQFNTFIDEAGAYNDAAGVPDPGAMAALRMINNANFPLHMAHLEDKGNVNFCSEMVWATTNRTFFEWKSMYCSEAYTRRFKVSMLHVPKVEYCVEGTVDENLWNRRLDVSKIPENVDKFDLSVNEFIPYDFINGKPTGPPISTEELIDLIVNMYERNRDHSDDLLNFHSIIKNKYIQKRFKPQFDIYAQSEYLSRYFGLDIDFVKECITSLGFFEFNTKEKLDMFWAFASKKMVPENLYQSLISLGNSIIGFLGDNVFLTSLVASLPLIYFVWSRFAPLLGEQSAPMKIKGNLKTRAKSKIVKIGRAPHTEQINLNQTSFDLVNKIAAKNLYHFYMEGIEAHSGFVLFIGDRIALSPEHFFDGVETVLESRGVEDMKLTFKRVGSPDAGFEVNYSDILLTNFEGEQSDVVFIKFPKVCHPHANLSTHFLSGDDKSLKGCFFGGMLRSNSRGYALITADIFAGGEVSYGDFGVNRSFSYNIATKNGECGAPIFMFDPITQKPHIVGIHVAGNNHSGMCNFIDVKFVKRVLTDRSVFSGPNEEFFFDSLPESVDMEAQMGSKFVCEGRVPRYMAATKSKVKPSPLHQAWGPSDFAPPLLYAKTTNGESLDPWALSRNKYSLLQPAFDLSLLSLATEATIQDIHQNSSHGDPWKPRLLSFEEACRGVPGVPFCEAIPRDTSAGYPFNLDVSSKGKQDFFGSGQDFSFDSPKCQKLRKDVSHNISVHARGERTDVVYADYLKDERRRKAKVALGKTRPISACPLDYLIECRMYFGDVVRWMMQNRIRNGMAIGVNAYSSEWSSIVNHLRQVGDSNIFGDYSGFDTSLSQALMYKSLEVLESYYVGCPVADKIVREACFMDVVNSKHVTNLDGEKESFKYDWYGSNPSGNFLTTVLNSISNLIVMRYAILINIKHAFPYASLKGVLLEGFRIITYGDDNGLSVRSDLKVFVDQQSMTRALGSVGMVYTNESKTEDEHTLHRPLCDCSFLKRSFVYNEDYKTWLAPLELAVVLEMPYWTKSNSPKGSVEQTVDTAMFELALHGSAAFYQWGPRIAVASATRLNHFVRLDYDHWLKIALHTEAYY